MPSSSSSSSSSRPVESMSIHGRQGTLSSDAPTHSFDTATHTATRTRTVGTSSAVPESTSSSTSSSASSSTFPSASSSASPSSSVDKSNMGGGGGGMGQRKISVVNRVKHKVREHKPLYYVFILGFLLMHWIDMITDMYMIMFYWEKDYTTYFCAAAIFFILSTLLSIFWNFELYNRSLGLAVLATIFGPVSRNLFVEIMPSKSDSPEGWRDSDEEETEEIKNFTMIFAAMFEDLPQASVNLAFMSKGNTAPIEAVIQVIASIVMGIFKIQHGCSNILCNYDEYDRAPSLRLNKAAALAAVNV